MALEPTLFDNSLQTLNIHNRRYLGSKYKLVDFIKHIVAENCENWNSFADIFAGTGVVGHSFNTNQKKIISNDYLYSNYISLSCWLSVTSYDEEKITSLLREFNSLQPQGGNYFSEKFGEKYFSVPNAIKIGEIRERIKDLHQKHSISDSERYILLTSLQYAADRIANTCGHYDAYRGEPQDQRNIKLRQPEIKLKLNENNEIYEMDANELVKDIEADIVYIDPPYNSRQYCDTYHLLENLCRWNKPSVYGKAAKMDRSDMKSDYCRKNAPEVFDDLIKSITAKYILVSYNNIGQKGDSRSNAKITDEQIISSLDSRGSVEVFRSEHQNFTAGKDDFSDHKERLFFCEVSS